MTGPGCPACAFDGRVSDDSARPLLGLHPCGRCSPWSDKADEFPSPDLLAVAHAILAAPEGMRAWAERLVADAKQREDDRAFAASRPAAHHGCACPLCFPVKYSVTVNTPLAASAARPDIADTIANALRNWHPSTAGKAAP